MIPMPPTIAEPDSVEHLARDRWGVDATGYVGSELDVLKSRQGREQVERVKHEADALTAKGEQLLA